MINKRVDGLISTDAKNKYDKLNSNSSCGALRSRRTVFLRKGMNRHFYATGKISKQTVL